MVHEPQRKTRLWFLAEPKEVNFGGKVRGGAVMREGIQQEMLSFLDH